MREINIMNDNCVNCDNELGSSKWATWLRCTTCKSHSCSNMCAKIHSVLCEMEPVNDYIH